MADVRSTDTLYCDVSEWQVPVDDSYPHPVLCIRSNDGTYRDKKWVANYDWCRRSADSGRLVFFQVYFVWRPNWQDAVATLKSQVGQPHPKMVVMLDVESWGGQITGNQSAGINAAFEDICAWLGDRRRVIGYGNQGDLDSLWPQRPADVRLVVAKYSTTAPSYPGQIAHQYTDGSGYGTGPQSSPPFGNCDHNWAYGLDPQQFAAALGIEGGPPPMPTPPPALLGEKVLDYDHSIVPQETGYWCGPASTQVCLNGQGVIVSEQELANEMGTDTGGTDYIGLLEQELDKFVPDRKYASVYLENDPISQQQKDTLWANLTTSIYGGCGVPMNWVVPGSNKPIGIKGSQSPAYGGGTTFHYVCAMGIDDNPAQRAVWIADSGFQPFGYWITFDQCATLIPPKGYTYAASPAGGTTGGKEMSSDDVYKAAQGVDTNEWPYPWRFAYSRHPRDFGDVVNDPNRGAWNRTQPDGSTHDGHTDAYEQIVPINEQIAWTHEFSDGIVRDSGDVLLELMEFVIEQRARNKLPSTAFKDQVGKDKTRADWAQGGDS